MQSALPPVVEVQQISPVTIESRRFAGAPTVDGVRLAKNNRSGTTGLCLQKDHWVISWTPYKGAKREFDFFYFNRYGGVELAKQAAIKALNDRRGPKKPPKRYQRTRASRDDRLPTEQPKKRRYRQKGGVGTGHTYLWRLQGNIWAVGWRDDNGKRCKAEFADFKYGGRMQAREAALRFLSEVYD
jgi:hypothetical protein